MLKVANLDVSIGPIPIIRSASLDLNEGEMCGLIGRNGAGKTTLLRAIMGAIAATGARMTVTMNGERAVDVNDTAFTSGPIALQYNSGIIKFRKLMIRPL